MLRSSSKQWSVVGCRRPECHRLSSARRAGFSYGRRGRMAAAAAAAVDDDDDPPISRHRHALSHRCRAPLHCPAPHPHICPLHDSSPRGYE